MRFAAVGGIHETEAVEQACVDGACAIACPPGQEMCDKTCVIVSNDPQNCGACGAPCPPGETCDAGYCALECAAGQASSDGDSSK